MKTVLILGSNSDVGQACAYCFARKGYNILLASREIEGYQNRLAKDIAIRHKVETNSIHFDALDFDSHQVFFDTLPKKPNIVISVFGLLGNHDIATADFSVANKIIDTNFKGQVSILGVVANYMESKRMGTIIAVSSVAGERGRPSNYLYGSAKAALSSFLSGLRGRLFPSGVHVITVIPGFINTKMIASISTPAVLTAKKEKVAEKIWQAYSSKKNTVYVLGIWRWIILVIKLIPEPFFKRIKL